MRPPEAILWRVDSAMAWRPSGVLGPVLMPPWFLHRPLVKALAWQGCPVERAYAPHLTFVFMPSYQYELLAIPLIQLRVSSINGRQQMAYLRRCPRLKH